jgi:hypothetical protein
MVARLEQGFGASFALLELGVMGSTISGGGRRRTRATSRLFEPSVPLIERVRHAKGQLNRPDWWRTQLEAIGGDRDRFLWLLALFALGSVATVAELLPVFDEQVRMMAAESRVALIDACGRCFSFAPKARWRLGAEHESATMGIAEATTICIFYPRLTAEVRSKLVVQRLAAAGDSRQAGNVLIRFAAAGLANANLSEAEAVSLFSIGYLLGADSDSFLRRYATRKAFASLGPGWAVAALDDSWNMPTDVLRIAQTIVENSLPNPDPVMRIAERQGWFESDN